ncbi:RNase H domain-containing protein [Trichonephila clavipes]|nr:RNase H domain-containing protein [Trichonephila clavipes]
MIALSSAVNSSLLIQALKRLSQFLVQTTSGYYLTVVVPFNIFLTGIHLQWVPSHVNIAGNEIADSLAKDGAPQPSMNSDLFTYSELNSTYINKKQSTIPPAHHWCSACQASPEHILDCLGPSKQDLYEDPLMVLDFLRVNEIMDLV